MNNIVESYNFKTTPLFRYIRSQAESIGLYIHWEEAKETLQIFKNRESFLQKERYLGAIQYEGSADFSKKEPDKVSLRFKRSNITNSLKEDLEKVTLFRCDKNSGPAINPSSESIAFKFHRLGESEKATIEEIIHILKNMVNKKFDE